MKFSTNPSVIRSQEWMYNSLINLMYEKDFKLITIKEIVNNADLDRTTFYRNFESKEDILMYQLIIIKNAYVEEMMEREVLNMHMLCEVFFKICENYIEFFKLIKEHNLSHYVLQKFNEYLPAIHLEVKEKFKYEMQDEYLLYALHFNTGGMWNILMKWIEDENDSIDNLVLSFIEISKFNIAQ